MSWIGNTAELQQCFYTMLNPEGIFYSPTDPDTLVHSLHYGATCSLPSQPYHSWLCSPCLSTDPQRRTTVCIHVRQAMLQAIGMQQQQKHISWKGGQGATKSCEPQSPEIALFKVLCTLSQTPGSVAVLSLSASIVPSASFQPWSLIEALAASFFMNCSFFFMDTW